MTEPRIETYRDSRLPEIVGFWNRTFRGCRNFFPIDEALFEERVVRVETGIERFEPEGLCLALDGERVVGLAHGGHRSEAAARALQPGWPGGPQPYIALVAVDPDQRRRGIGSALLRSLQSYLGGRAVLDGQCLAPFYGNALAPCQPLWGTTEGISVDVRDHGTRAFFRAHGYPERHEATSLVLDLAAARVAPAGELPAGHALTRCHNHCPALGGFPEEGVPYQPGHCYWTHAYLVDGRVAGTLISFLLQRLAASKWAIYEMKVTEQRRGAGIGTRLQAALVRDLQQRGATSLEVLTIPRLSPGALGLYEKFGFEPVARWVIY